MITGIAHVCYRVRDLDRALAFYVEGLGFRHAFDFKRDDGSRFGAYLKVGPRSFVELFVDDHASGAREGQSYGHLCLEVDDLARTAAELRARGVAVDEPKLGSDHSWQAWLADPDDNRIELHQYTPESWQAPHLD